VLFSENPNAIDLLEANPDKINWDHLSFNPNAIHLLEQNPDKIDWGSLVDNPNAIHLIEQNLDNLNSNCWWRLTRNPNAIHLLEKNPYKIDLGMLIRVSSMMDYDYEALTKRCNIYKEQLIQKTMDPSRIQKYLDMGISIDELDNHL